MKIVLAIAGVIGMLVLLLPIATAYHSSHTVLAEYDCRNLEPDVPAKILKECNYKNKGNK